MKSVKSRELTPPLFQLVQHRSILDPHNQRAIPGREWHPTFASQGQRCGSQTPCLGSFPRDDLPMLHLRKGWPDSVQNLQAHPSDHGTVLVGHPGMQASCALLYLVQLSHLCILPPIDHLGHQGIPPGLHELCQEEHRGVCYWQSPIRLHRGHTQQPTGTTKSTNLYGSLWFRTKDAAEPRWLHRPLQCLFLLKLGLKMMVTMFRFFDLCLPL